MEFGFHMLIITTVSWHRHIKPLSGHRGQLLVSVDDKVTSLRIKTAVFIYITVHFNPAAQLLNDGPTQGGFAEIQTNITE